MERVTRFVGPGAFVVLGAGFFAVLDLIIFVAAFGVGLAFFRTGPSESFSLFRFVPGSAAGFFASASFFRVLCLIGAGGCFFAVPGTPACSGQPPLFCRHS